MSHYNTYGKMAEDNALANITQNGRYHAQKDAEQYVAADVINKLKPTAQDTFLDIGCGLGLNIIPISELVERATGCDHPNVIKKLKQQSPDLNAELIGGNFFEINFTQTYSSILAYSVVTSLPNFGSVEAFIDKALSIVSPNGKILLGDLANIDKKNRFLKSERGIAFQKEWEEFASSYQEQDDVSAFQEEKDKSAVVMDDAMILDLVMRIRNQGFHAYIVDQPQNLPFGNTREDILILGPEYKDGT